MQLHYREVLKRLLNARYVGAAEGDNFEVIYMLFVFKFFLTVAEIVRTWIKTQKVKAVENERTAMSFTACYSISSERKENLTTSFRTQISVARLSGHGWNPKKTGFVKANTQIASMNIIKVAL